jgi:glycerate 2-kinase
VKVVVAPDSFGGTLTAREAAAAIAAGWRSVSPGDALVLVPMSDGGEGLLDVLAGPGDTWVTSEVAGPLGHPVDAGLLLRPDGTAIVESAAACGLHLVAPDRRDPLLATTYGVGQLLEAARDVGARRILVGLGGSATVDGGAGALTGLGYRLTVSDGSGLKIGGDDLERVAAASRGWAEDWRDTEVVLLTDVPHVLADAARVFGPQKGASPDVVAQLGAGLEVWAGVAERDLADEPHRDDPGSGAAGGLGFGLRCALPRTRWASGVDEVAALVGLDEALADADVVVTGEGRLDVTSALTKVVGAVTARAGGAGVAAGAVVGTTGGRLVPAELAALQVEASSPDGPGDDPAADVAEAAARLARRLAV